MSKNAATGWAASRLAVCLIARNEAGNLPRALGSITGIADEIILADTGSTDETPRVAAGLGARVVYFPWCDDFAAARNFALDHATAEWIFWLDADEELRAESVDEVRARVAEPRGLAHLVLRRDLFDAAQPEHFTCMWQERLFRRRPELRFVGRCHPHFIERPDRLAAAEGLICGASGIELNHYGYLTPELRRTKQERGVRLLELELRDRPGQLYYQVELGRTLLHFDRQRGVGVLAKAAERLAGERDAAEPSSPAAALLLEHLLQTPPPLPGGLTPQIVRSLCERWFPDAAPLIWLRAREDYTAGRFTECERRLRRLLELGRGQRYDRWLSFEPGIVGEDAALSLGACLVRQAQLDEAELLFRGLRSSARHGAAAEGNLAAIAAIRRRGGRR